MLIRRLDVVDDQSEVSIRVGSISVCQQDVLCIIEGGDGEHISAENLRSVYGGGMTNRSILAIIVSDSTALAITCYIQAP